MASIPQIVIGIPNKGFVCAEMVNFIPVNLIKRFAKINLLIPDSTPHDSTRNLIVKTFLESDATHLLFIDADVAPNDDVLEKLFKADVDIVAANVKMYFRNLNTYTIAAGIKTDNDSYTQDQLDELNVDSRGLLEVDMVGFGCVLIKRHVLESLEKPAFQFKYDLNGILHKGEDTVFCEKAKNKGFKIHVMPSAVCIHRKTVDLK